MNTATDKVHRLSLIIHMGVHTVEGSECQCWPDCPQPDEYQRTREIAAELLGEDENEDGLTSVAVDRNGSFVTDIEEARNVVATAFGRRLPLEDDMSEVGMWLVRLPKAEPESGCRSRNGATVTWDSVL